MGTDGLGARVRINRLAADRGRGRRVVFVVSIGLLPALAGCSSFSPSSLLAAGPPNNSSTVAGQSAAPSGYSPTVATAAAPPSAPAYTPSAPAAAPDFGPGFANVNASVAAPLTEDAGPSGLLVALFKSNSAPPAQTAAVPSPPGTYAPSAPATLIAHVVTTEHLCVLGSGRGSRFRSWFCERKCLCCGPADGRYRAKRPPCLAFQIHFYTACRVGKRAAPAEHLYRLGSALHAASGSACRPGTAANKFGAVITAPARSRPRAYDITLIETMSETTPAWGEWRPPVTQSEGWIKAPRPRGPLGRPGTAAPAADRSPWPDHTAAGCRSAD